MLKVSTTYPSKDLAIDPKKRILLNRHRDWLLNHEDTKYLNVDGSVAVSHYGNLYGYLMSMDINPILFYPILILSDLNSPSDFDKDTRALPFPSIQLIESIDSIDIS